VKESQAADGGRPPSGRRPSAVRRRFFLAFWLVLASANLSSATPTHCAPTPLVSRDPAALRPLVEAAAARHPLPALEPGAQVDWLMAILAVEMGPPPQGDPPGFAAVVYPAWQAGKALAACAGVDTTVGVAQVRPQTAAQIEAGWVENGGARLFPDVRPFYDVRGDGARGVDIARLARPEVSIEYLAANLEVGAAVAAYFGATPTRADLARWHNTGLGGWNRAGAEPALWAKGTAYVARVCRAAPAGACP